MNNHSIEKQNQDGMRLNKYLSDSGFCSRREADRLIEEGRVSIDGRPASLGDRVFPEQEVSVNGKVVAKSRRKVILAYNKPVGVICTSEVRRGTKNLDQAIRSASVRMRGSVTVQTKEKGNKSGSGTKKNRVNKKKQKDSLSSMERIGRVFPVGRLDKDSEGLLLLTNCGDIVNRINRGRYGHEKEYVVRVDQEITDEFLRDMQNGVEILDTVTRPCKAEKIGKYTFRIILTQGLNRQIRRMCAALGYEVKQLKRVRVMNIELGNLKPGELREITVEEERELYSLLSGNQDAATENE